MAKIDHVILAVNELDASVRFYVDVLGFELVGKDGPFTVVRVDDDFILQLAPYGTPGNQHYAFAMSPAEFERTFDRIKKAGIPYGDAFDKVGTSAGPGRELGARGRGPTIYFFDPNHHLLEIRTSDPRGGFDPESAK